MTAVGDGGAPPRPRRRRRLAEATAVALLLALHAGLAIGSLWGKAVTGDESSHLPAGLAAVETGEIRLNRQHPPLVKWLAGLAASTASPRLPLEGAAYRAGDEWSFGFQTLFRSGNDPRTLLRRGRLPTVALSVLGGLAVFAWSRALFGAAGGLLSLALYAFEPTVLAHARWVTMDVPVAALGTAALGLWWWAARSDLAPGRSALAGAALGLALAAKFSALLLLPAMALCELAGRREPLAAIPRRLAGWAIALATAAAVLAVFYLSPLGPFEYLRDAGLVNADHRPGYPFYLAGDFSTERFPAYFLVAMAVKSSLPGLVATLGGLAWAAWITARGLHAERRLTGAAADALYLWLPALVWLAGTSALAANIGVRYVLTVYPLLFVLAGALPRAIARRTAAGAMVAAAGLALAQLATAAAAHPDYLPWFNQLAGGPERGPCWLDDSNLDWGQDVSHLPAWLAAHGVDRVRLLPASEVDPELYGVVGEPLEEADWTGTPRAGWYAISAHALVRGLAWADERGVATDWLRRYRPVAVLRGSIYLYRFGDGEPAPGPWPACVPPAPAETSPR